MNIFIDETGDHDLIAIDPQYPIFMLGALLISPKEYAILTEKIVNLKQLYFHNAEDFILHSSELKRPVNKKSDPRNIAVKDPIVRKKFYEEIDTILADTDYKIVICLVKKYLFKDSYKYPI